jgi:3-dehydroquinate dehydratase II
MRRHIFILNGPNLNLLGKREPHLYGQTTLAEIEARCHKVAGQIGLDLFFAQSNIEGELINWVHEAREKPAAMVINPAGLSFFSVPLLDSLKTLSEPVVEVHITNIHRREPLYHHSIVSQYVSTGVICGLGPFGYEAALLFLARQYRERDREPGRKAKSAKRKRTP